MKSLEIVNMCLEELLNNKAEICEYDLLKIKQDLEVLEIIKKYIFKDYKLEKIYGISISDYWLGIRDKCLNEVNFPIDKEEEYNKLKQWLEGNEND